MKHLMRTLLLLLLLSSQKYLVAQTTPPPAARTYYGVAPSYSDLNLFWADFKKNALAKDVKKLADMSAFKFMDQNNMITKVEFLKDFAFARSIKKIAKVGPPKSTKDKHYDYDTKKYLGRTYSALVDDMVFYFCKINGAWKFTGISYGE